MRKLVGIIVMPLVLTAAIGLASASDRLPSSAMPMTKVLQSLKDKGYIAVRKVEYDDGYYEADAVNQYQQYVKVKMNPQTGEVLNRGQAMSKPNISMLDAAKRVLAAGYSNIHEIEVERYRYEVKAIDQRGRRAEIYVDASNGEISKDW